MIDTFTIADFRVGETVQAFNPGKFGVIDYGRITKVGRKWLHIDFGPRCGGVQKVAPRDVSQNWGEG